MKKPDFMNPEQERMTRLIERLATDEQRKVFEDLPHEPRVRLIARNHFQYLAYKMLYVSNDILESVLNYELTYRQFHKLLKQPLFVLSKSELSHLVWAETDPTIKWARYSDGKLLHKHLKGALYCWYMILRVHNLTGWDARQTMPRHPVGSYMNVHSEKYEKTTIPIEVTPNKVRPTQKDETSGPRLAWWLPGNIQKEFRDEYSPGKQWHHFHYPRLNEKDRDQITSLSRADRLRALTPYDGRDDDGFICEETYLKAFITRGKHSERTRTVGADHFARATFKQAHTMFFEARLVTKHFDLPPVWNKMDCRILYDAKSDHEPWHANKQTPFIDPRPESWRLGSREVLRNCSFCDDYECMDDCNCPCHKITTSEVVRYKTFHTRLVQDPGGLIDVIMFLMHHPDNDVEPIYFTHKGKRFPFTTAVPITDKHGDTYYCRWGVFRHMSGELQACMLIRSCDIAHFLNMKYFGPARHQIDASMLPYLLVRLKAGYGHETEIRACVGI